MLLEIFKKHSKEIFKKSLLLGCIGYTFQQYLFDIWILEESSMEPTLKDGQVVVTTYKTSLSRGDVIIVKHPQSPTENVCKRIIGELTTVQPWLLLCHVQLHIFATCSNFCSHCKIALPGDTVSYKKDTIAIPNGQLWLEGDNKKESLDSRHYGTVPIGLLKGVVMFSLNPLKKI